MFQLASIVFITAYLWLFVAVGMAIYTFLQHSEDNILKFCIVLGITIVLWLLAIIISGSCRCQLCQAPVIRTLSCSHHKNAKRLFGSYRLRSAVSILLKASFRCSYCDKTSSLKPQDPKDLRPEAPARRSRPSRLAAEIPMKRR